MLMEQQSVKGWIRTNSGMTSQMAHMINELRQRALSLCPTAFDMIEKHLKGEIMLDKMQFLCIKEILDRGIGKPAQMMEIKHEMKHETTDVTMMSSEQLQLMANNKVFELIMNLHNSGQLSKMVASIEGKVENNE
jgi:hypothetical protein